MKSSEYLKMNLPEYSDSADVAKLVENFEKLDEVIEKTDEIKEYTEERLEKLESLGTDISIVSMDISPKYALFGTSADVEIKWRLNTDSVLQEINGAAVEGVSYSEKSIRNTKEYTLHVSDKKGNTDNKTASISFLNEIVWGSSSESIVNSAVLAQLKSKVMSDQIERIFAASSNNEYVYYAYPQRLGTVKMFSGGLSGGFNEPVVVNYTNSAGYKEDYVVYRTSNAFKGIVEISTYKEV